MNDGALRRVADGVGGMEVVERLAGLPGSDFTTLMLEVARRRAARESPASVLRRYRTDRFCEPGSVPYRTLLRAETLIEDLLPAGAEPVTLAPVVPLGTHSVLDTVSQDKVVTAMRRCEVTADRGSVPATVVTDTGRQSGRGYYLDLCFKVNANGMEIGDGGFTDWTRQLL